MRFAIWIEAEHESGPRCGADAVAEHLARYLGDLRVDARPGLTGGVVVLHDHGSQPEEVGEVSDDEPIDCGAWLPTIEAAGWRISLVCVLPIHHIEPHRAPIISATHIFAENVREVSWV